MPNEDALTDAKVRFYRGVLENDVLAQLVLTAFTNESDVARLPDAMAEPWRPVDRETDQTALGMRFNMSVTSEQDALCVITFAAFQYLKVLTIAAEQSEHTLLTTNNPHLFFNASDDFMTLDVPIEEKRRTALEFMELWQQFCQSAEALGAHIDPLFEIFTTEVRSYWVE
jgi:hypothetical protein